ncbi:ABC transporter substrate-binding protein [Paeniglutamicibacter gangotriensis]|uniref:ABC transporter substrate-binding protein n=1 Tax=Paeniglutamicibacter gangotriensis TaxID=254787 RepID=A0A5B0ELI2_9MICC|nr:ABC transporter substrate-binding protein [Paeniglutamicibacter gangotriensis]KAA0978610.1 ABC transporter substrate-binding protein [Paeniglutamicibacter gangotriensis]
MPRQTHSPEPPRANRRTFLAGGLGLTALALTGCIPKETPAPSTPTATDEPVIRTFHFGSAADPATLDPGISGDNETFRITRQIYEGLIGVDRETGAPVPQLATDWIVSPDRMQYTFILRRGVTFHDGTDFNATAVVANFEHWVALPPDVRSNSDQGFTQVFRFNDQLPKLPDTIPEPKPETDSNGNDIVDPQAEAHHAAQEELLESLRSQMAADPFTGATTGGSANYFGSIEAADTHTVVLTLRKPITGLIEALTLPGLAMASPTALAAAPASGTDTSALSAHPVGTGPYKFVSWEDGAITLSAFADYWDAKAIAANSTSPTVVIFHEIRSPSGRLGALGRGDIDGFDMVAVTGLRELVREGKLIVQRDPYSVTYLGMNRSNPWLAKDGFRRAIAHSIDRSKLIEQFFISGTKEARGFLPASLGIKASDTYFGPDLNQAKELLEKVGYDGTPIPFLYPLNISRAYLPLPALIYAEISRQLALAGIKLQPMPVDWTDGYVAKVRSGEIPGLHLLGFNGGYRDPDDFMGALFASNNRQFDYDSAILNAQVLLARSMPSGPERITAYEGLANTLARDLPALPLAFPISALAFNDTVKNYPSSPVLDEVFSDVRLNT